MPGSQSPSPSTSGVCRMRSARGQPGGTGWRKMDLEVSEPIDFSSGDHQYLVRKTADQNPDSKSGRQEPRSSAEPQKTQHKPLTESANERLNTFVVQVFDEPNTNNSNENFPSAFTEAATRKAFITKVFFILSVQLLVTVAIMSVFIFCVAYIVVTIVLACCGQLRRQVPANYILLGLFTILQGLMLGIVTDFYNVNEVLWATAATTLVTLSLTLFALQTKWDFTLLNGMLFVVFVVFFIFGIIMIFVRTYWLHLLYAGIGTVIFSLYLVVDVQLMMGGHHRYSLNPEEYIFAALNIYLDIINLFLLILQLIGGR
ncbi:protein lifeguard 1-like [Nycticebus coucang]|uniref:protein lifeguard 1-like n=1 Tax=Nycticebus coucang TaxID=9470 RepID=UPI00234D5833|nr:protein lifeguard 1-like [Nycticebus coucang]